jgi:hypothetical protein
MGKGGLWETKRRYCCSKSEMRPSSTVHPAFVPLNHHFSIIFALPNGEIFNTKALVICEPPTQIFD